MFGRAYGKRFDQLVKSTDWYKRRHPIVRFLIGGTLDFLHHFWVGLLLMTYAAQIALALNLPSPDPVYFFGYGLFVDDLPDVPRRVRRLMGLDARGEAGQDTGLAHRDAC